MCHNYAIFSVCGGYPMHSMGALLKYPSIIFYNALSYIHAEHVVPINVPFRQHLLISIHYCNSDKEDYIKPISIKSTVLTTDL